MHRILRSANRLDNGRSRAWILRGTSPAADSCNERKDIINQYVDIRRRRGVILEHPFRPLHSEKEGEEEREGSCGDSIIRAVLYCVFLPWDKCRGSVGNRPCVPRRKGCVRRAEIGAQPRQSEAVLSWGKTVYVAYYSANYLVVLVAGVIVVVCRGSCSHRLMAKFVFRPGGVYIIYIYVYIFENE